MQQINFHRQTIGLFSLGAIQLHKRKPAVACEGESLHSGGKITGRINYSEAKGTNWWYFSNQGPFLASGFYGAWDESCVGFSLRWHSTGEFSSSLAPHSTSVLFS